ncbi:MAG: hypothetical protein ACOY3D_05775 [Candidatus Omnitrophota bacterium]
MQIRKIILSTTPVVIFWLLAAIKNDAYFLLVRFFQGVSSYWIPALILTGYLTTILSWAYFFDLYRENSKLKSDSKCTLTFIPKLGFYYNSNSKQFFCPKKNCNTPLQQEEVATENYLRIRFICPNHGIYPDPSEGGKYITSQRAHEIAEEEIRKRKR